MGRWWVLWVVPDEGTGGILVLLDLEGMSLIPAAMLSAQQRLW